MASESSITIHNEGTRKRIKVLWASSTVVWFVSMGMLLAADKGSALVVASVGVWLLSLVMAGVSIVWKWWHHS